MGLAPLGLFQIEVRRSIFHCITPSLVFSFYVLDFLPCTYTIPCKQYAVYSQNAQNSPQIFCLQTEKKYAILILLGQQSRHDRIVSAFLLFCVFLQNLCTQALQIGKRLQTARSGT